MRRTADDYIEWLMDGTMRIALAIQGAQSEAYHVLAEFGEAQSGDKLDWDAVDELGIPHDFILACRQVAHMEVLLLSPEAEGSDRG
jgi:hypothetical protein